MRGSWKVIWGNRSKTVSGQSFGSVKSFELCTEGLQALEQYANQPDEKVLDLAEQRLSECVLKYPDEMLPKFYLGSAKTLRGEVGLKRAIDLLQTVVNEGSQDLQFAAQFN